VKKLLPLVLIVLSCSSTFAQLILGSSPYNQDFNSISTGLPPGISIRAGSTASALGAAQTFGTAMVAWNNTSGAFKNFASANGLVSGSSSAQQNASSDRSLGIRQTGTLGDPGGAFVLQLANTSGLKDFKLTFKLQSLDITSPRTTVWRIDYGFGPSPTTFTAASATGTVSTGGTAFTNNIVNVDFGNALDNRTDDVWIRIVTVVASTGSGNRASSAIDDLSLTYNTGTTATPSFSVSPSSLTFGSQAIGTTSAAQNHTLTYANLDGSNVVVATAAPFAVSKSAGGPFSASIIYTAAELSSTSIIIYSEFSPTAVGPATGTITHTGGGVTGSATVSLAGNGISLSPAAANDSFSGLAGDVINGNVATNDSDPQGLVLSFNKLTDPVEGSLTFNADGTFSYQSVEGSAATQIFTYRATNTQNLIADATVTINLAEKSKIFISQYYEGTSVNKWIELTNPTSAPVNTASPQLKLGLYSISGDAGNIVISGSPTQIVNLNVIIPAKSSVLIGNTGNGAEVPYLTAASAQQSSNSVINFNGNDGVALLDAVNNIVDAFGTGVNAKDVSYVRNQDATTPSPIFINSDWTRTTLATVQNAADLDDPNRLGVHVQPELPPCVTPTSQPTNLTFSAIGTKTITLNFDASPDAGEYLIVRSLASSLSAVPADGTVYNAGTSLGGGTVLNRISGTTYVDSNLSSATNFNYFIFALNSISCDGGPRYLTNAPLAGSQATDPLPVCVYPTAQPTNFHIAFSNYNVIQGTFTPATGTDESLVIMSRDSILSASPVDQTTYAVGDSVGGGIVIKRGTQGSFSRSALSQDTFYYFYIFSLNSNCSGGPLYGTQSPLTGRQKTGTLNANTLNYYFGNLHSHSSYSDGNKDDLTKKPEDDYAFAKNSRKMDFLGISEHNHTQAGMRLANWGPGIQAAKDATTPGFVALHGMEWGVISGGGHVVVYGIDSLIGWEPGEYQIFVPKSTYTGPAGLFNIINRHGLNAVATLAHPNTTDYNNVSATYDPLADSAIVGSALESGPAFSTNVTYSDPASSMSYLNYYNRMLSKGYHLGATVDHDNHNLTFGRHTRARLVVLAPALTENDLLDAMKKMRFYASEDSAARISYTINDHTVGSIFSGNGAPKIAVSGATTSPVATINIMSGVPGSGITAALIASVSGSTLSYSDTTLTHLATGYYYADIVEADGSRIITSPIWYTRNDSIKSEQTITFNPLAGKIYGDGDFDPLATSSNATIPISYTSSDSTIVKIVNNKIHIRAAGTVIITARQPGNHLYKLALPKTQELIISPLAISANADPKAKTYGDADPAFTYTYTPALIGSDAFTGALSRDAGEHVGQYVISQGTLALSNNYALTVDTARLVIAKRAVIANAEGKTKVYGTVDPLLTFIAVPPLVAGDVFSGSLTRQPGENAGTYVITQGTLALNDNYTLSFDTAQFLITKAPATLTLANLSQVFDGNAKQITVNTNPAGLDSVRVLYNGSSAAPSAVGSYSVVATLTNENYNAAPVAGTLVISYPMTLKVQYRNADGSMTNNEGKPYLKIVNTGLSPIAYNDITARYWITPENFTGNLGLWIDYAQLGNNKVTLRYVAFADPRVNALGYIEYGFTAAAGSLAGGANSGEIQSRYANSDWSTFNELNDYSIGSNTTYADKATVTLYRNGVLVWGTEPQSATQQVSLRAFSETKNSGNNTISTWVELRNDGNVAVDYRDITARYWFTSDGPSPLNFWIDYAKIGNSAISGHFFAVNPARSNANAYLELNVTPTVSTFYPLTGTGNIQYRITKADWSNFNQSNDYSYKAGAMSENSRITIYYRGQLVYGTEPAGGSSSARIASDASSETSGMFRTESERLVVYPNPSSGNFTIQMNEERLGEFKATIHDSAGKIVDAFSGENTGSFRKEYNLEIAKGLYFVRISWKYHGEEYKKLIIH
jgi:hypothetical protein